MEKWDIITRSDKYKALPPEAQVEAKQRFFQRTVVPLLEENPLLNNDTAKNAAFAKFMQSPDDTGEGIVRSTLGSAARGFGEIVPGTLQGVGALTGITPISDLGESARAGLEYVAPVNPIYEQGILAKVANVAGNVVSIIGTSGVGGLAGKALGAERAAAAGSAAARQALTNQAIQAGAKSALYGTGFAQGAAAKAEENKRLGITGAEGYLNLLGGGVSELAPEMLPFGTALESAAARRLLGGVDDAAGRVIPGIRMSAAQEAAEGGSTQVLSNLSTQLTAPTGVEAPDLFEGAGEAALWEGVGGAMFGAINKLGRTPPERQTDEQRAYAAELGAVPVDSSPPITPEESLENFNQGGIPVVSPDGVVTTLPFNREDIRATDLPFNREDIRASELPFTREDIRPTQLPFNREDIRSTELPFSRQNIRGLSQLGQPAISPGLTAAVNTADSIVTTAENTSSDVSQATTAARNIIQGVVDTPQPREAPAELPAVTPSPAMEQTENLSQTITDSNGEIAPEMSVLPPTVQAGAGAGEAIAEDGQLEPSTSIEDQKEALKDIIALKKGRGQDVAELESKLQSLGADTIPDFVEVNPETPLHPFTSEKPLLPIKVEVSDAGVRSIDSSVKQIEKLRKSLNGKLARASGANKFSIESDIYAADKALQELGRVGREIESYLKPINPQGKPTPATEGKVMPGGSAIKRDVSLRDKIASALDADDVGSAILLTNTEKKDVLERELAAFIPVGNAKTAKELRERFAAVAPRITKSATTKARLESNARSAEAKLRTTEDKQQRHLDGLLGPPISDVSKDIATDAEQRDPHGVGKEAVARMWQAEVDDAKARYEKAATQLQDYLSGSISAAESTTAATKDSGEATPQTTTEGSAIERETDEQKFQRIKSMSPSQRTDEDIAFANAFSKRQKELKPQAGEATRKAFLANHTASIGGRLRKALDQTITFRGLKGTVGSWAETLYNEGWRMALDARGNRQFTNGTEALGSSGLGKVGMNYADFLSSQPQTTTVAAPTEAEEDFESYKAKKANDKKEAQKKVADAKEAAASSDVQYYRDYPNEYVKSVLPAYVLNEATRKDFTDEQLRSQWEMIQAIKKGSESDIKDISKRKRQSPKTEASAKQTATPSIKEVAASGVAQSKPVEGSIPTVEQESPVTAIESTEKTDVAKEAAAEQTRREAADAAMAREVEKAEKEQAKLEADKKKRDELGLKTLNSLIEKTRTNVVQGTVKSSDANQAVAILNKSGAIPNVLFTWIGTSKDFLADPANRARYPETWKAVSSNPNIEGMSENGQPIVFTDNVGVSDLDRNLAKLQGTTPEVAAVRRVILHENIHKGMFFLSLKDKMKLFQFLHRLYSPEELDQLAKSYDEYSDWRINQVSYFSIIEEAMTRDFDSMAEIPRDGIWAEFMQFLRDIWQKITGKTSEPTLKNYKDVFRLIRNSLKNSEAANADRLKNGGGVRMSMSEFISNVTPEQDAAYAKAVESGDMETAQRMVDEAAEKAGLPILNENEVTAYKVRRKPAPKKTEKAYKLFRVKKGSQGEVFALFVGANDPLPQGIWLDATEGPRAEDSKTGKAKVKSKLGPLAYRPGWHAGDVPLATHIGASDIKGGPIVGRKFDEVWAEVEMASDVDYQPEANANGVTKDGSISVALADIKKMPEDGLYRYKTNPNMTGQWIISGSMKINRILSENEVNSILEKASLQTMPWMEKPQGSKTWSKTPLNLEQFGLGTNPAANQKKLLDTVTYDDAGNVIPLSRRFQSASNDIRFSKVTYDSPNEAAFNSGAEVARNADYDERDKAVRSTIRAAYDLAPKDNGPSVPLDQLFDIAKQSMPDLTENEFSQILQDLYEDSGALLQAGESPFIVTTPDGQRAGSAIIVSSLPTGAMASTIDPESDATKKFVKDIQGIESGTLKAAFGGRQFFDFEPVEYTVRSNKSYEQTAINYVNNFIAEGGTLEQMANSVIAPNFLAGIGIEDDVMARQALVAEVRNRIVNAGRKKKSKVEKKFFERLNQRISAFWQGVGTKGGRNQGQRAYIIGNPRYSWMFLTDEVDKELKQRRDNILNVQFGNDNATSFTQNSYENADMAKNISVDEIAQNSETTQEDIDLAFGETVLDGEQKTLWERTKDWIRELGIAMRHLAAMDSEAKKSVSDGQRNAITRMSRDEVIAFIDDRKKKISDALKQILGDEAGTNSPVDEMVKIAKKRASKGLTLDALESDSALTKMLREINQARRGAEVPLKNPIPWRKLLSQKAKTVEEYRQRIFDAISANEELKSATPEQKARLADLFTKAWESNRKRILDGMQERLIREKEAKGDLSKKGAEALQEQRMRMVEDINLGIFDNDEIAKIMAEKFGIKSEFTDAEREKIESLIEILQDEKLNRVKRNKAAYELLETLSAQTDIPISKLLANFWVSSVLSGMNTVFSIGMSVFSGMGELTTTLYRIFVSAFSNPKQLPSEVAAAFKTLARVLSATPRQANRAWQYLVTGDQAFLDPTMNDALKNMDWDSIGKNTQLAEQMAKSDKTLQKVMGLFMRTVSRLLTALDLFNSGLTKEGSLSLVFRQLNLDPSKIEMLEKKSDLKAYKAQVIRDYFNNVQPKTLNEKALVESYAMAEMMKALDELGSVSENADQMAMQGAMTLDPSGIGGYGYRLVKSMMKSAESGADKLVERNLRKWDEAQDASDKTEAFVKLALSYIFQFAAYNAANLVGVRFARFAGNKFNQSLSFLPIIGALRLYEAEFDADRIRGKEAFTDMIKRNQLTGVMAAAIGYYVLKAIAEEPDDEKRGAFINGGWSNLTPEKKQQKLASGQKEYTLGFGDTVINYGNWPGSGIIAAIGGLSDLIRFSPEQWSEKTVSNKLMSATASGVFSALEVPALSQFQELFGSSLSSKDPNEQKLTKFARVIGNYAGGFVPRILKDIDYAQDPSLRKYETLWEKIASHIPVYRRYEGKEYYDILGQQIQRNIYPGSREFMVKPTDPAYKVLGALNSRGIWLTPANAEHRMVGKGARRRSLTQEEADNYSLETGKGYKQMLLRYGQRALQMPTERAKAFLLDKADDVRDRALKKVYRGYTPAS